MSALGIVLSVALLATSAAAHADDRTPTCDRLRAEAHSEAVLLYAPRLQVQGARAPSVANADDPTAAVGGVQGRVVLAMSPIDMLRGRAIERVADAECAREQLAGRLDRVLAHGARHGELAASHAELAVLDHHTSDIDALVADVVARFERQRATALEVDELRERRNVMRIRIADLRHAIALLEELEPDEPVPAALGQLATEYRDAALAVDRRRAQVRGLSAWRLDLRAGVAGGERADWFAIAELSYSLGQPWQAGANRAAVAARGRELATDDRELTTRLARLQRAMQRSTGALAAELVVIDEEIAETRRARDRIDQLETTSDAGRHLRARQTLKLIQLEARRASVHTLATMRRPFAGESP